MFDDETLYNNHWVLGMLQVWVTAEDTKVGETATYLNILDVDIVDYSISTIEMQGILRYINIPTECNFR